MNNNTTGAQRPQVLLDATETQIEELERQFAEQDKSDWMTLTNSYGWSAADSQAVWNWFAQRPLPASDTGDQANAGGSPR